MAGSEFFTALGDIAAAVVASEDKIVGTRLPRRGDPARGFEVARGNLVFAVIGYPSDKYLQVRYTYRLSRQVEGYPGAVHFENDQIRDAAVEAQKDVSPTVDLAIAYGETDEGDAFVDGIQLTDRLYPYDDGFGLGEYDKTIQQFRSTAVAVCKTFADELDILDAEDVPQNQTEDRSHRRGIH